MEILLDTNILLRLTDRSHPHYGLVKTAIDQLISASARFAISSQTIYEFLAVATRPASASGLGMASAQADAAISALSANLNLIYDSPVITQELRGWPCDIWFLGNRFTTRDWSPL